MTSATPTTPRDLLPALEGMSPDAYEEQRKLHALIDPTIASPPLNRGAVHLTVGDEGSSVRDVRAAFSIARSAVCRQIMLAHSRLGTALTSWRDAPNDEPTPVRSHSSHPDSGDSPRPAPSDT